MRSIGRCSGVGLTLLDAPSAVYNAALSIKQNRHHSAHPVAAAARSQTGAAVEGRTLVWVDEAGFDWLPGAVRTYAPRGQPPTLRARLTRDHLPVIGAVTATGKLLLQVQAQADARTVSVKQRQLHSR